MSLDISFIDPTATYDNSLSDFNITHNLIRMARVSGVYDALWGGHGMRAKDIIQILKNGIAELERNPEHYKTFNAVNGWGTYDDFLPWIKEVLCAAETYPESIIEVWS